MRALLLLLSLLLAAAPAVAERADAAARLIPSDPAPAAPLPPDLSSTHPAPSTTPQPPPMLPMPLAAGLEARPGGGWRLLGEAAKKNQLDAAVAAALAEIARHLAQRTTGRVTVIAEVAGPVDDASMARRASLAAGQTVKQALQLGGLDGTRIDIRPLGRTPARRDVIEVLPPGAQRDPAPR